MWDERKNGKMKFDTEDFVARPWKYLAIGFALCFVAAYARNPEIGQWSAGLLFSSFGMPLVAGVIGYVLLKRRSNEK